jgi:hypothetical protein
MQIKTVLVAAALLVLSTHSQAQAAIEPVNYNPAAHPFSLEAGAGMNGSLPFFHAKFGWRIPLLDNRLEPFFDYSFWNLGMEPAFLQVALLGIKYHFDPIGQIQPFVALNGGMTYLIGGPVVGNIGFVDPTSAIGWAVQAGGGMNLMMSETFGFSGALYLSYPFVIRPELNLRWTF